MGKKAFVALTLALLSSLAAMADSYASLWKKYDTAVEKDQPRTQIKVLDNIIAKATHERAYGHLIKAQLASAQALTNISPDSLAPAVNRIETAEGVATNSGDKVLAAVYESVLGSIYKDYPVLSDDAAEKSKEFYKKSMTNPDLLSKTVTSGYEPFVIDGVDSRYFYDDLLHVVAINAGDYKTLHDYYAEHNLREGACLAALMQVKEKNNDGEMRMKKSKYVQALDSLLNEYGDLPVAGELAIERYEFMSCSEDATAKDKMNYIDYALTKWGAWPRMNVLRNAQRKLTLPMFHVSLGKEIITAGLKRNVVVMSACNIGELKLTVSRLKLDGTTNLDPSDAKEYERLRRSIDPSFAPQTSVRRYFGKANYEVLRDTMTIQPLSAGMYLVEISTDNVNITPERALLHVSNLYPITEPQPGKKIRLAVLDAVTGKPVPRAHADIVTTDNDGKAHTQKFTCDNNGETYITYSNRTSGEFRVYTDDDTAFPFTNISASNFYSPQKTVVNRIDLHTDRSIYRPGQTVHVAAVVYKYDNKTYKGETANNTEITITLRDANHKEIAKQTATTDEFGMASTDFALPQSGLTGRFTVSSDFGGRRYASFSVEEYKRPTFNVEFDKVNVKYKDGDTITVRGTAKSFAGVPVQGAKVAVKVTRRPSLLWRFARTDGKTETVLTDTVATQSNGTFSVKVPMELPETAEESPRRYYMMDVTANVTDGAGETRHGETSLPLSDHPTVFSCDLPEKALRDSLNTIRFSYKNNNGEDIDGDVTYFIDSQRKTCKANVPVKIDASKFTSARHTLTAVCGNDTIMQNFVVFTLQDKHVATETHDWFYVSSNSFPTDGKPVYIQVGSSDSIQHVVYTMMSGDKVLSDGRFDLHNEVSTKALTYKEEYGDGVVLSVAWVKDGIAYRHTARLRRPLPDTHLNVKWTTFRNRLMPGQKETWTLNITTPDGKPAKAQLLATMYDKSLDLLRPHSVTMQLPVYTYLPYLSWNESFFTTVTRYGEMPVKFLDERSLDLSHFSPFDINMGNKFFYCIETYESAREGGNVKYTAPIRIRGLGNAQSAMASEDAVELSAVKKYKSNNLASPQSPEPDAGETAQDSNQGKNGGEMQLRENLNETAFFFPGLVSDDKGNVTMKFTLPESVTTWQFYGLAHDTEMNNGVISGEAVAKKTVMVQPNVPRFVRSADQGTLQARIANTSEKNVNGIARLTLINPETDKEVYRKDVKFSVKAGETTVANFPFDMQQVANNGLLICRVTASGHGYSDGEQHFLPVLPDKELITNTVAFSQNGAGTTNIDIDKLFPVKSKSNRLTVEYTNNPAWMMIQALPSIASTDEENAISLATAFYANSIGHSIMNSSVSIKKVVELWKKEKGDENSLQSSLEKNQELKSMVLEETPWLIDANRESEQKRLLSGFFDESTLNFRLNDAAQKLQRLQLPDGSFAWWKGMCGSQNITVSVLMTLVRLNAMIGKQQQTSQIVNKAFAYLSKEASREVAQLKKLAAKGHKNLLPSENALRYLYASAIAGRNLNSSEKAVANYLVDLAAKQNSEYTIYGKALSAIVMAHYNHADKAKDLLQSIKEYTVYKEEMGRYFDSNNAYYSWFDYRIPSQVAAIEALQTLTPDDKQTISDMQRWLLQSKRTQCWDTPVNSVDAIYSFMKGNEHAISTVTTEQTTLKINGNELQLPKATAGLGYVKTVETGDNMKTFSAEKATNGVSWGAVYAQFMQSVKDVEAASSGLSVKRELLKDGKKLAEGNAEINVGDRITVRISITADRDYDFVQVSDKRAACLEAVQQTSGYGFGYYCTPKDNTTNYYFDRLSKGRHVIETTYYADRSGSYATGTCTVQCAYSPEFSGRASASVITVK